MLDEKRLKTADPRIIAIRSDSKVGHGSCTSLDECWSDQDLLDLLNGYGVTDPAEAVKHAYRLEGFYLEHALNARWGEDDDPQLLSYRDWHAQFDKPEDK